MMNNQQTSFKVPFQSSHRTIDHRRIVRPSHKLAAQARILARTLQKDKGWFEAECLATACDELFQISQATEGSSLADNQLFFDAFERCETYLAMTSESVAAGEQNWQISVALQNVENYFDQLIEETFGTDMASRDSDAPLFIVVGW